MPDGNSTRPAQLSFGVGGLHAEPAIATFRLGGELAAYSELGKGDEITVVLSDADGQVIASGQGWVRGVGFREHRPKDGPSWTERTHAIKLED